MTNLISSMLQNQLSASTYLALKPEQLKVVAGLLQIGVVYDKTFGELRVAVSSVIDAIALFLGDVEINLPEIDRIIPFETIQGIFATVNFAVKN